MRLNTSLFSSSELNAWIDNNGGEIELSELADFFNELFALYEKNDSGEPLIGILQNDWNLFSSPSVGHQEVEEALKLCGIPWKADTLVKHVPEILAPIEKWEIIKKELRINRRFLAGELVDEEEDKWDILFEMNSIIPQNAIFYRGRINAEKDKPYTDETDLSAPPQNKALPGRANPYGIPFLYLTNSEETVIYELRSLTGDQISIGRFRVIKDLNVVSFSYEVDPYAVFVSELDTLFDSLQKSLFLAEISKDMRKPVRRYDDENLDYLPTQFVCEYIRLRTKADGILYPSSRLEGGSNIVLFDKSNAVLDSSHQRTVGKVTMEFES